MRTKRLFWRFFLTCPNWSDKVIGWEHCPEQLGGVLYSGPVLFGRGIIYSDSW